MHEFKPTLERRLDHLREPFAKFISAQSTASGFLLFALLASLWVANSQLADWLTSLQHFPLGILFGNRLVEWSLIHLVNDGLIAIFFFLIGLEVKRELLAGELQKPRRVGLLLSAAFGGMLLPAALYLLINLPAENGLAAGWGIPIATDTALAIGVLAMLAARVPKSVVAFLVGVAIIDDIGAILVIALFYTAQVDLAATTVAGGLLLFLVLLNRAGLRHPLPYIVAGTALWIAIVQSGIHASIAGVVVAATVPARPRIAPREMKHEVRNTVGELDADAHHSQVLGDAETHENLIEVERLAKAATTPLRRWEDALELPVALLILPLFAFLNAGLVVNAEAAFRLVQDPVALGVIAGLVLGKPVGIWAGVRLGEMTGIAERPSGLSNRRLLGVGMLAGVGFTMSTFIAQLAIDPADTALITAKLSIVAASALAAAGGFLMLYQAGTQAEEK
jgi:NhaA family Na+:H+ antiporter